MDVYRYAVRRCLDKMKNQKDTTTNLQKFGTPLGRPPYWKDLVLYILTTARLSRLPDADILL